LSLLVDTSVWSYAFRRDPPFRPAEAQALVAALEGGEIVLSTGLILQELLQGFSGPKARQEILSRFTAVPMLVPSRDDHVAAAELRNRCRRAGVQIGTIDALLGQLCLRHDLTMLTADDDFRHMAGHCALRLWNASSASGG
jgi:predicted nucleic acid-binding protein